MFDDAMVSIRPASYFSFICLKAMFTVDATAYL